MVFLLLSSLVLLLQMPNAARQVYAQQIVDAGDALFINIIVLVLLLAAIIAITVGVIYVQQALRKIPIQYAKRVAGTAQTGRQQTHLPLKVNAAGVIPVIFAICIPYGTTIDRFVFWFRIR